MRFRRRSIQERMELVLIRAMKDSSFFPGWPLLGSNQKLVLINYETRIGIAWDNRDEVTVDANFRIVTTDA